MKEKKYRNIVIVAFILTVIGTLLLYTMMYNYEFALKNYTLDQQKIVESGYISGIDTVENDEKYIKITGWLIKKGEKLKTVNRYVILKEKQSDRSYKVATVIKNNQKLTTYLNDGINYSSSGFYAAIPLKQLKDSKDYEVYIADFSNNNQYYIKIMNSIKNRGNG